MLLAASAPFEWLKVRSRLANRPPEAIPAPNVECSSSGTPSTCRRRSLVNACKRVDISLRGSEEGARGSCPRSLRVARIDRSSSSWISGNLEGDDSNSENY